MSQSNTTTQCDPCDIISFFLWFYHLLEESETCNNTEYNSFCTRDVYFFLLLFLQIDNLHATKFSIFKNVRKLHISEIIRGLLFCLLTWWSSFCLEVPQFTNKPPPKVVVEQATTVSLCCVATGSPRPKVEWTRHQRSTLFSPFFQEDGCLAVNTAKAHGEEDYICRATNSFGLTETVTTVIATKLMGIKTVIIFITFQLYIQNTFPL